MSRNILSTVCYHCEHPVDLHEFPRPILSEEAGQYFKEFEGMLVAPASCPVCEAQYLAWIDTTTCVNTVHSSHGECAEWGKVLDLSYYSTFDDEPGESDLPKWEVHKIVTWHRVCRA